MRVYHTRVVQVCVVANGLGVGTREHVSAAPTNAVDDHRMGDDVFHYGPPVITVMGAEPSAVMVPSIASTEVVLMICVMPYSI